MTYNKSKFIFRLSILSIVVGVVTNACSPSQSEGNVAAGDNTPAPQVEEGFIQIFDGKTLDGWEGDSAYWRVVDGNLVGEISDKPLKTNSFIVWRGGHPRDFEFKTEFRITEGGNSGVNYRSEPLSDIPHALRGYQADIDGKNNYTGQNYEERGRTTLAYRGEQVIVNSQPDPEEEGSLREHVKNNAWTMREVIGSLGTSDSLKALIKANDWNTCHIIAKGNRLQHYINGVLMSEVTDNDEVNRKSEGILGMQVHVGPPMKVEYRNIRIKEL